MDFLLLFVFEYVNNTHTDQPLKARFCDSEDLKRYKSTEPEFKKLDPIKILHLLYMGWRK